MSSLNQRAEKLADRLANDPRRYAVEVSQTGDARIIDCGIEAPGGIAAGLLLARICMGDLGEVAVAPPGHLGTPMVQVSTDHPVSACMASQYAGWQISLGDYFAMGSGPMRAVYGGEELFETIGRREASNLAVGVLETRTLPTEDVVAMLCDKTGVAPDQLTLLVAPTGSMAGAIQVVARSVETCLHKLYELGFDIEQVITGYGTAPLPPFGIDDLATIGTTNDAMLYGARVSLWCCGSTDGIKEVGPKTPSNSSSDYGLPFGELFKNAGHDFYKIDPLLFSPAEVTFNMIETGEVLRFGETNPTILKESFERKSR